MICAATRGAADTAGIAVGHPRVPIVSSADRGLLHLKCSDEPFTFDFPGAARLQFWTPLLRKFKNPFQGRTFVGVISARIGYCRAMIWCGV
ncbi:MAG TPA: hypothetical protein VF582_08200 [Allosphingosinicella sp.]